MTTFAKFAAPAVLAFAAFGAQAAPDASQHGQYTPSAGGQYRGPVVQSQNATPGSSMTSDTGTVQPSRSSSVQQRTTSFLGA